MPWVVQWQQNTEKIRLWPSHILGTEEHLRAIFMRDSTWQVSSNYPSFSSVRTTNGQYQCRGRNRRRRRQLLKKHSAMDSKDFRWTAMTYSLSTKRQNMPFIRHDRVMARHSSR